MKTLLIRWRFGITTLCGLGILVVALLALRSEPEFEGKRLSAWLEDLQWVTSNRNEETKRARHDQAAAAIRQMGPGVIPILLSRLRSENSKWEHLRQRWDKTFSRERPSIAEENARIFAAIEAVGKDARGSIQEMMHLLETGQFPAMAIVLGETFGEEALPYLVRGITNSAPRVRSASITGVRMLGERAQGANDLIIAALRDVDNEVRLQAAVALRRLRGDARAVVPALTIVLNDTDPSVQEQAAISLGKYGREAASAVPSLQTLATRPDQLGKYATEALKLIGEESPHTPRSTEPKAP